MTHCSIAARTVVREGFVEFREVGRDEELDGTG